MDGWQGQLTLDFAYTEGHTTLAQSHSTAPLKVQRPFYPEGLQVCHSVIVHTAGGMVGGDRLNLSLSVPDSGHAVVTTAASSKAYKSNGPTVQQSIKMTVGAGGCLEWLPQSLILFNGAQYLQTLHIDLAPGATWIGWDITRLGRTVRGERFDHGLWRSRIELWQNGIPIWIDPQQIEGGSPVLTSPHGLDSAPVIGTFAFLGSAVHEDLIHQARQLWDQPWGDSNPQATSHPTMSITPASTVIPTGAGPTAKGPTVKGPTVKSPTATSTASIGISTLQSGLICRYRGASTVEAQRWFMQVWNLVRQTHLQRPSCPPRVWQIR